MADMFNTFRDPVYWDWYRDVNGNKTSVLRTNESHVVVNNYIVLMEIPDEYYKVQIEGMSEIPWDKPITNPNQFKVFYTVGWIEFHPSMEASNVLIKQYYSKGICYIPASRIYTELDNDGNVTETMQKYIDSIKAFQYRGIYSDEETYYINHQVYYNGSTYICLRNEVKGDNPTDTNTWRVMAGGLNRKGNFDDAIQYNERDIVWYEENHTLYLCKNKPPIGTLPTDENYWDELLTLNDVVSLINNKIDEIENRMSTIENDYNTKKEQWDAGINNKINEAEHKIVNVESRMSTIEDDYNNQKSQWNDAINEKVDEANDKILDIETIMTNIETEYENNLKPDILQATQNANDKAQLAQISADQVDVVINQYEENVKQNIKILKPYVETYAELLSTYPNPENGWTVKVAEEGKVYRWNEIEWVAIDIDTGDVELAELKADVGNKNNLTTENKNSLVDAINEVNNKPSFDGDYENLTNKPFIPTKTSELENDADFETVSESQEKADEAEQNAKTYTDQQITLVTEALSDIETNVGNVETEIAAHKADYASLFLTNADAKNSIYRGKYLGNTVTAEQYTAISSGTFTDLYIGDYWTIGGVNWRIAAFNYYRNTGDSLVPGSHITIVPDTQLYTHVMNDTDITTGGYIGSKMYTEGLEQAKTTIRGIFGTHLVEHRQILSNATVDGKASGWAWLDSEVELMNEIMVYGASVFGASNLGGGSGYNIGVGKSQLPLFRLNPRMINTRQSYWLRDVVSASYFACVSGYGYEYYHGASVALGVRPAFSIS